MRRFLNVTFTSTFPLLLQLKWRTFSAQYELNLQTQLRNFIFISINVVVKSITNKQKKSSTITK